MTDRYDALIVILDRDVREDDIEPMLNAIRHIRGVLRVEPQEADYSGRIVAETRLNAEWRKRLLDLLQTEEWQRTDSAEVVIR